MSKCYHNTDSEENIALTKQNKKAKSLSYLLRRKLKVRCNWWLAHHMHIKKLKKIVKVRVKWL